MNPISIKARIAQRATPRSIRILKLIIAVLACASTAKAQDAPVSDSPYAPLPVFDALSTKEWRAIDKCVDRGLAWLATKVEPQGGMPTAMGGQPAVTSLTTMAFLSRGHRPGVGPYGKVIDRMLDYALAKQKPDGLFLTETTDYSPGEAHHGSHTAIYNHAITGMMLGEVYGMADPGREERIQQAMPKAIAFLRKMQLRPSPNLEDKGGWRYFHPQPGRGLSDLSVTGWCVMFYRSARNAEFEVPEEYVSEAAKFVRGCYDSDSGGFVYAPLLGDRHVGRGMTGAGLLCLTMADQRDNLVARAAGQWILDHPFTQYQGYEGESDRFHYGAYYCSQAMFMLGGDYWREFYPVMAQTLLDNQQPAGNWQVERSDERFGEVYTTALAILALTPPYQLLPIYQR
jgi:hypothetical protein